MDVSVVQGVFQKLQDVCKWCVPRETHSMREKKELTFYRIEQAAFRAIPSQACTRVPASNRGTTVGGLPGVEPAPVRHPPDSSRRDESATFSPGIHHPRPQCHRGSAGVSKRRKSSQHALSALVILLPLLTVSCLLLTALPESGAYQSLDTVPRSAHNY